MKIYCAHSSAFDYQHDWYDILRNSSLIAEHDLIFPHEVDIINLNSYSMLQNVDCVIAEVSHPSTWMGIELWWAYALWKPIFCFYKIGTKPSWSLVAVTQHCLSYNSHEELIQSIAQWLSN